MHLFPDSQPYPKLPLATDGNPRLHAFFIRTILYGQTPGFGVKIKKKAPGWWKIRTMSLIRKSPWGYQIKNNSIIYKIKI